jgi:hypothetical protein
MAKTRRSKDRDGLIGFLDTPAARSDVPAEGLVHDGLKHGWYLADVNVYPRKQSQFETDDLGAFIRRHIVPGHAPARPMLDVSRPVITLGSCFARELRLFLSRAGVDARRFWIPSGLNNTFAILDFFSWCVTGMQTGRGFRYEETESGGIQDWTPEAERAAYRQAFADAGAFVLTLGLAEVWQDRDTGAVFWRGVPKELFDENRHVFRLTTVEENVANLRQTIGLVRQVNPSAPIVLTLSPVPLLATHRPLSCLTADCVSKSVLRVALDQVMADQAADVYNWPSFEIVKWMGATVPWSAYGENGSSRDVNRRLIGPIIDAFVEAYYRPEDAAAMRRRLPVPPAGEEP